jgi:hypothetical protein
MEAWGKFQSLAKRMFTPRPATQIPGLGRICKYLYSYVYMTTEAEKVLKETFTEDKTLFGAHSKLCPTKVAVTTVCEDSSKPRGYLLSNYSRPFVDEGI